MQKIRKDEILGANIQRIRKSRHMTQEEVAAKLQVVGCDISRSVYSQIEGGRYNICVSELIELKKLFKVDYSAFSEEPKNE